MEKTVYLIPGPTQENLLYQQVKEQFVFRRCKDMAIFSADYYKKWHVQFIVQSLAAIVQLFVQLLVFSPCSRRLSAALQRFSASEFPADLRCR